MCSASTTRADLGKDTRPQHASTALAVPHLRCCAAAAVAARSPESDLMGGPADGLETATQRRLRPVREAERPHRACLRVQQPPQADAQAPALVREVPEVPQALRHGRPAHPCLRTSRSDFGKRKKQFEKEQRAKARKAQLKHDCTTTPSASTRSASAACAWRTRPGSGSATRPGMRAAGTRDTTAVSPTARSNTSNEETPVIHVLIALGLVAGYALFLLVRSDKTCQSCQRYRGRPCRRCGGTGRRFRLGARLVHRGAVQVYKQARRRPNGPPVKRGCKSGILCPWWRDRCYIGPALCPPVMGFVTGPCNTGMAIPAVAGIASHATAEVTSGPDSGPRIRHRRADSGQENAPAGRCPVGGVVALARVPPC
jgi:hypothetical protein